MKPGGSRTTYAKTSYADGFILAHRWSCRDRVRAARLAGPPSQLAHVLRTLALDADQQSRVTAWRRAGFSQADAVRIVIDPTMRREVRV